MCRYDYEISNLTIKFLRMPFFTICNSYFLVAIWKFLPSAHVIGQVLISLALFLMLCDTYLFRVGLLGILFTHFKHVLMLQPIYVIYTLFLDGYRVVSTSTKSIFMNICDIINKFSEKCLKYFFLEVSLNVDIFFLFPPFHIEVCNEWKSSLLHL